ncbi:MAG: carboxylating nicotinate-nucleotide diphosphorylase [Candidatus Heimdallarchaeota archaeon]|nr:MAG: carboxylating nicotinate-nucleotide diphosphorylase [Candidatus Heimdallarchaeota archaeon]
MSYMPPKLLETKLLQFLEEDINYGDLSSDLVPNVPIHANIVSKQEGVICGLNFAEILLKSLNVEVSSLFSDGDTIRTGDIILQLRGLSRVILASERTILNILMRLSGIATQTRRLVAKIKQAGQKTVIASTRKTTPGFRYFEKYAVIIGGGDPHRWNLSDTVLIKENHLRLLGEEAISIILNQSLNKTSFTKKVEIEVENLSELRMALKASPDIIMLDDFSTEDIHLAIDIIKQTSDQVRPLIEVSGGINDQNIDAFLIPGVDIISMGMLTHSTLAIDFSLRIMNILPSSPERRD